MQVAAASERQTFSHLTDDDREILAAATGIQMDAAGNIVSPNTPGLELGPFLQIELERQFGSLVGPITTSYLHDLKSRFSSGDAAMQNALDRALDFLLARENDEGDKVDVIA